MGIQVSFNFKFLVTECTNELLLNITVFTFTIRTFIIFFRLNIKINFFVSPIRTWIIIFLRLSIKVNFIEVQTMRRVLQLQFNLIWVWMVQAKCISHISSSSICLVCLYTDFELYLYAGSIKQVGVVLVGGGGSYWVVVGVFKNLNLA